MRRNPSGVSKEHEMSNIDRNSTGKINCHHSQTFEKSVCGLHERLKIHNVFQAQFSDTFYLLPIF